MFTRLNTKAWRLLLDNILYVESEHSTVTYTSVSFPVEDDSYIGSPGVDGPPIMPEDPYAYIMAAYEIPPSPDYILGPEIPPSPDSYLCHGRRSHLPHCWTLFRRRIHQDMFLSLIWRRSRRRTMRILEEDPADYPADGDDDEDEDEDEEEEKEEEHPAPTDSVPPVHRMTARISIRDEPSISLPPREEVERLLALTTPPPSPLTPLPQYTSTTIT
ncbi:hypothetical protein Tco_0475107 [Tanacetum coccineum]